MTVTDADERIALLEERLAYYDQVVARLVQFARLHPRGRILLKMLGLP